MQVIDDFNRADSTDLGPNWVELRGDLEIASGVLRNVTAGAECFAHWSSDVANTVDMFVEVPIVQRGAPVTLGMGVLLRKDGSPNETGYYFEAIFRVGNAAFNTVAIYRVLDGDYQPLVSQIFTLAALTVYLLRAECQGPALRLYMNGALIVSTSDGAITTGKRAAVRCFSSSPEFAEWQPNFRAGDLTTLGQMVDLVGLASTAALGNMTITKGAAIQTILLAGIPSSAVRTVTVTVNRTPQLVATSWAQEKVALLDGPSAQSVLVPFDTPTYAFTSVQPGVYRWKWVLADATGTVEGPGFTSAPFVVSNLGDMTIVTGAVGPGGFTPQLTGIASTAALGNMQIYLEAPAVFHAVPRGVYVARRNRRRRRARW